jgi:hypothetical protein
VVQRSFVSTERLHREGGADPQPSIAQILAFGDASVTRETCVAIEHADNMFLLVGLGVLCFVE